MQRPSALALKLGLSGVLFAMLLSPATVAEAQTSSPPAATASPTPPKDFQKNPVAKHNDKVRFEQRPAVEFTSLEASGDYDIEWVPGEPSLSIQCDKNLFNFIKTEVSDGKLRISSEQPLLSKQKIKVVTSSDTLNALILNGNVHVRAKDLSSDAFSVHASGAAYVDAFGYVSQFSAVISGASQVRALRLTTLEGSIEAMGNSNIEISVVKRLKASVIGASSVTYAGSAKVESSISGTGQFKHLK